MDPSNLEIIATVMFASAVIHTFLVNLVLKWAHHYPEGSIMRNFLHFMGEVEVVFGFWAALFIIVYSCVEGFAVYDSAHQLTGGAVHYLESLNFTEPAFVFVIMAVSATTPIMQLASKMITLVGKILPFPEKMSFYIATLVLGPLLGSLITEPAAMTVTALILKEAFYDKKMSTKFMYATIGLLFVNVSIGGTLSHFAAPPVLMVASKWHWGFTTMILNFGYKAFISIAIATVATAICFKSELSGSTSLSAPKEKTPIWITLVHILTLVLVVFANHHMVFFLALFLFFVGFTLITEKYQESLKIRESLSVGFFLAGLVTLGTMQTWWLKEVIGSLGHNTLYVGATLLTAVTDNAALTYLGSLVELSDVSKYFLVAGAVVGGGLTVIANAPNPAGYGILKSSFGEDGVSPVGLFKGALLPTILAFICFYFLPNFAAIAH